jgi:hypothetical protein
MVATEPRPRLKALLAPGAALLAGLGGVAFVWALKPSILEAVVGASGLPAFLPSAAPPLGDTAQGAIALFSGVCFGFLVWVALTLLISRMDARVVQAAPVVQDGEETEAAPVLRRADAHPDAPPRPPLRATRDLGTPFLDIRAAGASAAAPRSPAPLPLSAAADPSPVVRERILQPPVERALPADLRQPLAAFDPSAMREEPLAPAQPVPPLQPKPARPTIFNPHERFETFELTPPSSPEESVVPAAPAPVIVTPAAPVTPPAPVPLVAAKTDATVHALLARLERGVATRESAERRAQAAPARPMPVSVPPSPPPPPVYEGGLQDALVSLRNLAVRN